MKKVLIGFLFLLLSVYTFGQVTAVADLRIQNATTAFGTNLPIGTKVYNIADGKLWVATAGVLGTATLTTASASFTQLNMDGSAFVKLDQTTGQTLGTTGSRLTKLWATDITVTNAITGSITGNAATVTTNANLTGEVTSVGNATTVTNAAVIGKVLTGYSSAAGTVSATDNIVQAINKLNGNQAATAALVRTPKVDEMEMATADSAAVNHYHFTLSQTPVVGTITVSVNGSVLKSTSQWILVGGNRVRIG